MIKFTISYKLTLKGEFYTAKKSLKLLMDGSIIISNSYNPNLCGCADKHQINSNLEFVY